MVLSQSLIFRQPIIYKMRYNLSLVTLLAMKWRKNLFCSCLSLLSFSRQNLDDSDRKTHLWVQIGWTLNFGCECCAFITLQVLNLLFCLINPLLTFSYVIRLANVDQTIIQHKCLITALPCQLFTASKNTVNTST